MFYSNTTASQFKIIILLIKSNYKLETQRHINLNHV